MFVALNRDFRRVCVFWVFSIEPPAFLFDLSCHFPCESICSGRMKPPKKYCYIAQYDVIIVVITHFYVYLKLSSPLLLLLYFLKIQFSRKRRVFSTRRAEMAIDITVIYDTYKAFN